MSPNGYGSTRAEALDEHGARLSVGYKSKLEAVAACWAHRREQQATGIEGLVAYLERVHNWTDSDWDHDFNVFEYIDKVRRGEC